MSKKYVTIYCGSSDHAPEAALAAAREAGRLLAQAGATLITGGGRSGLMGAAAEGALAAGGEVTGIIPGFMVERGWHNTALTRLLTVDGMHQRKALMASMSHGVIALPGGIGTFDELTEIITWRQLGLYSGNIVIGNINGYFRPYLTLLDHAVAEGFMHPAHLELFTVCNTAAEAVAAALAPASKVDLQPKFR